MWVKPRQPSRIGLSTIAAVYSVEKLMGTSCIRVLAHARIIQFFAHFWIRSLKRPLGSSCASQEAELEGLRAQVAAHPEEMEMHRERREAAQRSAWSVEKRVLNWCNHP